MKIVASASVSKLNHSRANMTFVQPISNAWFCALFVSPGFVTVMRGGM